MNNLNHSIAVKMIPKRIEIPVIKWSKKHLNGVYRAMRSSINANKQQISLSDLFNTKISNKKKTFAAKIHLIFRRQHIKKEFFF